MGYTATVTDLVLIILNGSPFHSSSPYECVICKATFDSYEEYKPHMKVACRRRIEPIDAAIKKEPPHLVDENSILLNGGIMMTSEGLISAADVIGHPIAHLHHLHPHLPPHHQASPSYLLP